MKDGGILPRLFVGLTDNFSFGMSYGLQNFIGNNEPSTNKASPEVQVKYRAFEETQSRPAIVFGLDTQGKGKFANDRFEINQNGDTLIATVNRYETKSLGLYVTSSKNWNVMGNLGVHLGLNKSITESDDGDDDINFFFGIDKELNRSFSLLLEYNAALNDNNDEYKINDLTYGKGIGLLNAGIRWAVASNLMLEINFNDISKKVGADYTNREVKIMYSERF